MSDKVLIFGDICPDNDYRKFFDEKDTGAFSAEVVELIQGSGLAIANFECPATNNKVGITKCGPNLRAEPKDIKLLKHIGFDVLSLANNHILDYGMQGIMDTLESCRKEGILTVGAGEHVGLAAASKICEVENKKIGIVSFAEAEFNLAGVTTPGAHHFDPYESFDQVKKLKKECDYVIVLYHGGIEYYKNPSPLLQKKCRKFAQFGADLVLCQHSHCIGTIEQIGSSTILYGQGNTLFGYRSGNSSWNEGLAVSVDLSTGDVHFILLTATEDGIFLAGQEESDCRVKQMFTDSERLNDSDWINKEWLKYANMQACLDLPLIYGWGRVFIKLNRILKNRLINKRYSKRKLMVLMNLIRCEAHHEVVQTVLEERIFHNN